MGRRRRSTSLRGCAGRLAAILLGVATPACGREPDRARPPALQIGGAPAHSEADRFVLARARMVHEQLEVRGVRDLRVLDAMRRVPRQELVPVEARDEAYDDHPVSIGYGQTISQPLVVAIMTELLETEPGDRVLEIGTGSGYQAAVLSLLVREVYTIEIVEPLARRAERDLARLGYRNVHVRAGDGYAGWREHAPYDGIVVTAAAPRIPEPLKQQLAIGGKLVIPVGEGYQMLRVVTRTREGFTDRSVEPVLFVPMTGRAREER
ncbi:MAG: protein-L-isoaspartate(D-aspartate) O-methyltransferase [Polyangiales bacterium]